MLRLVAVAMVGLVALATNARATPIARVIVLATHERGTRPLTIDVQREGGKLVATAPTAYSIAPPQRHADGAMRATISGDDVVYVAADATTGRFASSLWRVNHTDVQRVVDAVATNARPLLVGRRVYVSRGRAAEITEGTQREDELAVVELDLDGNTVRTVAQAVGETVQPIGVDDEPALLVYGITPHASGNVLAFDLRGNSMPRDLGSIGRATALSFVTRLRAGEKRVGPAVLYEGEDAGVHVIAALGLDGERSLLYRGSTFPVGPFVATSSRGEELLTIERVGHDTLVPRAANASLRLYQRFRLPHAEPELVVRDASGNEVVISTPPGDRWEPVGFGAVR